jgi:hypothetical protein
MLQSELLIINKGHQGSVYPHLKTQFLKILSLNIVTVKVKEGQNESSIQAPPSFHKNTTDKLSPIVPNTKLALSSRHRKEERTCWSAGPDIGCSQDPCVNSLPCLSNKNVIHNIFQYKLVCFQNFLFEASLHYFDLLNFWVLGFFVVNFEFL